MKKKKNMNEIFIAETPEDTVDLSTKFNTSEDIIFSVPEGSKKYITFGFSGGINFRFGEPVNLSNLRSKSGITSPIRSWKTKLDIKMCLPRGIHPLFLKPDNYKSIIGLTSSYVDYLNVKVTNKNNAYESVVYQDIEIELTFNKDNLLEESPMLIIPSDNVIFNLLPVRTFFCSNDGVGNIYLLKNDEFYNNFKESI